MSNDNPNQDNGASSSFLLYTESQANFLAVVPYFTAPWSIVGSGLVLWSIWWDRRELLKHVYHRMMFGVTLLDLFSALGIFVLGPWTVPPSEYWPYGRSGRGSTGTCEASGFLLNLAFGSMWYTVFLAIQFVLLLRCEWKERRIACCLEPLAAIITIILVIISGLGGIASDVFNPLRDLPGWCWYSDNPPLCAKNNTTCIRGEDYGEFAEIASTTNALAAWIIIVICMTMIVLRVRRLERDVHQHAFPGSSTPSGTTTTTSRRNSDGPNYARTKATTTQALLYIGVFFVTYSPLVVIFQMADYPEDPIKERKRKLPVALLVKIFTPLQGFLNAIVYFRHRFGDLIQDGKSLSFLRKLPFFGRWIEKLVPQRRSRDPRRRRQVPQHQQEFCEEHTTMGTSLRVSTNSVSAMMNLNSSYCSTTISTLAIPLPQTTNGGAMKEHDPKNTNDDKDTECGHEDGVVDSAECDLSLLTDRYDDEMSTRGHNDVHDNSKEEEITKGYDVLNGDFSSHVEPSL